MSEIFLREGIATDKKGKEFIAQAYECECGCHFFMVFWIGDQDHPHYECAECHVSYCSNRSCIGKEKNAY